MSEIKKIETVELEKLKSMQDRFNNIILQLGQISVELIKLSSEKERLESLKSKLEEDYRNLRDEERKFSNDMTNKYGPGILNPETGEFTSTIDNR